MLVVVFCGGVLWFVVLIVNVICIDCFLLKFILVVIIFVLGLIENLLFVGGLMKYEICLFFLMFLFVVSI